MEWYWILVIVLASLLLLFFLTIIFYKLFFKRFWDIVLSGLTIIVFSPIFVILIIAGAIAMKGNPFFIQKRPGKINKKTGQERLFNLIKFRTMSSKKDENGQLLPDEKRLNKYGAFLRTTSLDELPELFNIFIGEMSIVGPRPQLVRDMVFMSGSQRHRHIVRPGLTGLAQINGRNNITWEQKFGYDLIYLDKITFLKDLSIVFKTVFKVFKRDDTVREGTASDIDFGDWLLIEKKISKSEYDAKQLEAEELLTK